jgi:tetratricopeptide (TPR) repeat protein
VPPTISATQPDRVVPPLEQPETVEEVLLRAFPNDFRILRHLSKLRSAQGDSQGAIDLLRSALSVNPQSAEAFRDLARALWLFDRPEDALSAYQRALSIDPKQPLIHAHVGEMLVSLGRIEEAIQALEMAVELAPQDPAIYLSLALTKQTRPGDRHVPAMEKLAEDMEKLPPDQQIVLHFGLGRVYADLQEHDRSFRHLLAGNTLKRQWISYDERNSLDQLDRARSVFTAELLEAGRDCGDPSELPVFIFGMPRSGTTLVEQILASHPLVFGAGELGDFDIRSGFQFGQFSQPTLLDVIRTCPERVSKRLDEATKDYAAWHLQRISAKAPGVARVTDKTTMNFRLAGLIHLAFPNARMIHVKRDPIDTCLSAYSLLFARGQFYTYDLGELGRYYHAYEKLMEHWRTILPSGAVLDVQYEDLVVDFEFQARRLVEYCGLEWSDDCLSFHRTTRPIKTASAIQARRPIYNTSVGRWRPTQDVLKPLVAGLGAAKPSRSTYT